MALKMWYAVVMTHDEFLATLRARIHEAGSQRAFCKQHHIAVSHLYYILSGSRFPTDKLLKRIGFKRQITYSEIK